jgi:hypothetical protein
VPPKGLVNFTGTGAEQLLKDAKVKAEENRKDQLADLKEQRDEAKELSEFGKKCVADNDPGSKDNVGSGACDEVACGQGLKKCKEDDEGNYNAIIYAMSGYYREKEESENRKNQKIYNDGLTALRNLKPDCADPEILRLCQVCVKTKQSDFINSATPDSGNAGRAGEHH